MDNAYQWVPFYEAMADKLLTYNNKRGDLFELMKKVASEQPLMKYLHFQREDWWGPRNHQIDPFSVIGVMNRGNSDANRTVLAKNLADALDVTLPAPMQFRGIPVSNPQRSFYAGDDEIWDLFVLALQVAESEEFTAEFKFAFDKAIAVKHNGLATITMGLFWIRPNVFMPLDSNSREYASTQYGVFLPRGAINGDEYVSFLERFKAEVSRQTPGLTFPEISHLAWSQKKSNVENITNEAMPSNEQQRENFIKWYAGNVGPPSTANTYATAMGKTSLKTGKTIFAITDFDELNDVIVNNGLVGFFQSRDGAYEKMDIIFNLESSTQRDDLKGGINYYLEFLKGGEPSKLSNEMESTVDDLLEMKSEFEMDKNIIIFGAPGTGKTYSTVQYAVSIVEEKPLSFVKQEDYKTVFARYLKYKEDGLIAFTTFHQSFGYEEFIEGIRPVISSGDNSDVVRDIDYEIKSGVFKEFCDAAGAPIESGTSVNFGFRKNPTVWKVSLEGTGDNSTRTDCMENNHIRIGWDGYGKIISDSIDYSNDGGRVVLNTFYNRMEIGDIVFSCYSSKTVDAIGVVTGDPEWSDEYESYKRLRKVRWLVKGINEDIVDLNNGKSMTLASVYSLSISVSDVLELLKKVKPTLFSQEVKIPNRVFIIDEINRGNISKIFGELITLIEPSKRIGGEEQLRTTLPYSGHEFGVPQNVYIIGTMNTADRSIALIDTALRRRFGFVEMLPEPALLAGVLIDDDIDIAEMLSVINKRITVLLDREHVIGHSYFLPLKREQSIQLLAEIFKKKIIPLLQEYFYDDYEKIQLILGDNQKPDDSTRFIVKRHDAMELFKGTDIDLHEYYEINNDAFTRKDAYEFLR